MHHHHTLSLNKVVAATPHYNTFNIEGEKLL